jgi:hypothetical protein
MSTKTASPPKIMDNHLPTQGYQQHWNGNHLVVVDNLPLKRGVISLYHDSPTAGHPGISNTTWAIACDYWWPNMKQIITEYVKGCHLCQSQKNNPTKPKPPLFPIPSDTYMLPFTSVAMDFIVKLPISEGYNSILTITDTFSKSCIFLPCHETIDTAGVALLYATYIFPITDYHHDSYLTGIHFSWQQSYRNSPIFSLSNTMPAPPTTPKQTVNQNVLIRSWNNTHALELVPPSSPLVSSGALVEGVPLGGHNLP